MQKILYILVLLLTVFSCGTKDKKHHNDEGVTSSPMPPIMDEPAYPTPTPDEPKQSKREPIAPTTPAPFPSGQYDNVYGMNVPSNDSWRTENGQIYYHNFNAKLRGLSWFGFEGGDAVVHGLWTGRTIDSFLKQVKDLGFNSLRIPLSPQVMNNSVRSTQGNPYPLSNLTELLSIAAKYQISILLDLHTCNYRAGLIGNPLGCSSYDKSAWFNTLRSMAELSKSYTNVLGIDVFNEPYNLSWKEWKQLSSEAAKQILTTNPRILVFIEGVGNSNTNNGGYGAFWGENMTEAGNDLPDVPRSRLVFSPHAYGPSVAWQPYFNDQNFPNNMPNIWDTHFGYLTSQGFTLVMGEFGGRYNGADKLWQDKFIDYLIGKGMRNAYYWSLNPNSGDTGGILNDDWRTVNVDKINLLRRLFNYQLGK